jgi:hypothetical protein
VTSWRTTVIADDRMSGFGMMMGARWQLRRATRAAGDAAGFGRRELQIGTASAGERGRAQVRGQGWRT